MQPRARLLSEEETEGGQDAHVCVSTCSDISVLPGHGTGSCSAHTAVFCLCPVDHLHDY